MSVLPDVNVLARVGDEDEEKEEDEREWENATGYFLFSPTQITTYLECARKWAWDKIAKVPRTSSPSAALGTRVHKILELYLGEGLRPDFVKDRFAAEIASSGLHFLPEPKTPGMLLEQEFRFQSPRTSFIYHGFKDVSLPPGSPIPALAFDGQAPIVLDHKTTKSISKWGKTDDDLRVDPQSCLYGYDAMARYQVPFVDEAWIYYQTEGPRIASPTRIRLTSKEAAPVFDVIERVAEEAATALTKKLQPLDLAPNPRACGSYGGCPYERLCNLKQEAVGSSGKLRSRMSNTANALASLKARLNPTITEKAEEPKTYRIEKGDKTFIGTGKTVEEAKADAQAKAELDAKLSTDETVTLSPSEQELLAREAGAVKINPPEGSAGPVPAPVTEPAAAPKKRTSSKKEKGEQLPLPTKDPVGADIHAHTDTPKPVIAELGPAQKAATVRTGFTLYADCLPIGRPAKSAALLIAKAQERYAVDAPEDLRANDYRFAEYGKGTPYFVKYVVDQVDGSFDIALDTRTPEGALLLEPLTAKAALVVRGIR